MINSGADKAKNHDIRGKLECMKKLVLFFCFLLSCLFSTAQTVRQTLEGIRCVSYKDGILVYGYEKNTNGYSFSITHYNSSLKIIHQYSKEIPGNVEVRWSRCTINGDIIDVYTASKPTAYFIKLSSTLQELCANEITPEVREANNSIISPVQNITVDLETETGNFQRGIENIKFCNSDLLNFSYPEQSLIKHKPLPGLKLDTRYSQEWVRPIEGIEKVKSTGIIYADNKDIFHCFITKGKHSLWDDFIVRVDSKTGQIKNKIFTVYPDKSEVFFLSNAYFDPVTEKIVAVGQLYQDKFRVDMHATVILVYDKEGSLVMSKKIEFPVYEIPDAPRNIDLNEKSIVVQNIGRTKEGHYLMITAHRCRIKGTFYWATVGYSYTEINDAGEVITDRMAYLPDLKIGAIVTVGKGNEKYIVVGTSEKELLTVQVVNFEKNGANMLQKIDAFDYFKDLKYDPDKDVGVYKQFILDDTHTVIYHKFAKSDMCELKSITVK
ncbi:MAG: hypothetical protein JWO09_2482 [Bacteroidetes bacterium]|nr:hypothetical protein [Bacteroidota bacterium]